MDFIPSNLPAENEYPKLIRDRIPEIISAKGGVAKTRVLGDEEFLKYLFKKMVEESTELVHSLEKGNTEEELADVMEIFEAILKAKGWSLDEIRKIQNEKRAKNGGFEKKLLMMEKS